MIENTKEHNHTRSKHYRLLDKKYQIMVLDKDTKELIDRQDCNVLVADLGECTCGAEAMVQVIAFFPSDIEAKQYETIMQLTEQMYKDVSRKHIQKAIDLKNEIEREMKS